MRLRDRLAVAFIGSLFIIVFYAIGIGIPKLIGSGSEGSTILSDSTIHAIELVGHYTTGTAIIATYLYLLLLVVNLLPKPNYAYQLAYGNVVVICLIFNFIACASPFVIGLTVGAFGWIGFLLQLLVCVYLWKSLVISSVEQLKQQLYKVMPAGKDLGEALMKFIKRYGGILLALSIINRWTFNFGDETV